MTTQFLHVGFSFTGGRSSPTEEIQYILDKGLDWVRYAPNNYILYTAKDVEVWYNRLRKVIHEDDNIFIVEINIKNRQGWLPSKIWDWIKKDRID
jgi:hypothetical protein